MVTASGKLGVFPRAIFRYQHRVSLIVAVLENGKMEIPAAVFRGVRDPRISNGVVSSKV